MHNHSILTDCWLLYHDLQPEQTSYCINAVRPAPAQPPAHPPVSSSLSPAPRTMRASSPLTLTYLTSLSLSCYRSLTWAASTLE